MRKRVVSRTLKVIRQPCLCLNLSTRQNETLIITLDKAYKSDKARAKKCAELTPPTHHFIMCDGDQVVKTEVRYMDYADFIEVSKIKE